MKILHQVLHCLKEFAEKTQRLFSPVDNRGEEALQQDFIKAASNFKRLISANNKALEVMAQMELALAEGHEFDVTYVRTQVTRVNTAVYQLISCIEGYSPEKFAPVKKRFQEIQKTLNNELLNTPSSIESPLVVPFSEITADDAFVVGGKAANLGELKNNIGVPVPDGVATTSNAFWVFMRHNELHDICDRRLRQVTSQSLTELYAACSKIRQDIVKAPVPEEISSEILRLVKELGDPSSQHFAVRSSAVGEDGRHHAFAGQYLSRLNVSYDELLAAWKEVVASKYSPEAVAYRKAKGLATRDLAVCVAIMPMQNVVAGGVIYSTDPIDCSQDVSTIHAAHGLPKGVVDGRVAADIVKMRKEGGAGTAVVGQDILNKEKQYISVDGGVELVSVPQNMQYAPVLTLDELKLLQRYALKIEEHYGCPQDIEWGLTENRDIIFLQSRPLSQSPCIEHSIEVTAPLLLSGGDTVSTGIGYGELVFVQREVDALTFPEGAILVVQYASPRWAPLLSKANGVISGTGSRAGHLASVAREYGVPGIFGVGNVDNLVSYKGDATLDAPSRKVYAGKVEELLALWSKQRRSMKGTPVYEMLASAVEKIVPLHLTDPTSPDFTAENCTTLHDITRFCHEYAIDDMFRVGRDMHIPSGKTKQLYDSRPMQYWVVDLDDGFITHPAGKYITFDNISSTPMHAIWKGMTAVKWAGPPPVNAKSFLSILAESTCDPSLVPDASSVYTMRNYFLISSKFCCLQFRFGYHFCTVEVLGGDVPAENFISMKFSGGAADLQKKNARVRLLAIILDEYDFRVTVIRDRLSARCENMSEEDIMRRLYVVGHLLMHTRQLDMILHSEQAFQNVLLKLRKELATLL